MMTPRLTLSRLPLVLLFLPVMAEAQLSAPPALPSASSGSDFDQLSQSRTKLMAQLDQVQRDMASLNQRCSHVATTDVALTADCGKFHTTVSREIDDYRSALASYESDAAVVDARNVPSGLPKFVDEAIVSGYSGAPPGVSDRVRKGFQAVAAHDWNAARAWFGDALNHDPQNAGLKRLAELADFTLARTSRNKAAKTSSAPGSLQLPESSDMQFLFPGDKGQPAEAGAALQLPKESDAEFLFPGLPALEAKELSDYTEKHWINEIGTGL